MSFLNKKSLKPKAGATRTAPAAPVEVPATPTPPPNAASLPRSVSGVEKKPSRGVTLRPIEVTHEAIAMAAYFRWQRFGGDEATNWCLAEQELREEAARIRAEG